MAETVVRARSPIEPPPPVVVVAGWEVSARRSSAELTITDHTPLAKVAVKATWDGPVAETLGVRFGHARRQEWPTGESSGSVLVTASAPGEWLVLAPPAARASLVTWLEKTTENADELVSVIDLTHGRALMRIAGASSADLLAKECGLDLSEASCPDGSALRSAVAGVAADLIRDDLGGIRSYLVHCERSAGQYLSSSLLDAGLEFGVEVAGFELPGI